MLYVGLDVHSRQSSLCILKATGGVVNRCEVKGPRSAVVGRLQQLNEPFSLCYEASCGYSHLYEQVRPLARHVAVAHPAKLRLIFGSKRKNNRFDAEKLAKLCRVAASTSVTKDLTGTEGDVAATIAWSSLVVPLAQQLEPSGSSHSNP